MPAATCPPPKKLRVVTVAAWAWIVFLAIIAVSVIVQLVVLFVPSKNAKPLILGEEVDLPKAQGGAVIEALSVADLDSILAASSQDSMQVMVTATGCPACEVAEPRFRERVAASNLVAATIDIAVVGGIQEINARLQSQLTATPTVLQWGPGKRASIVQ